MPKDRVVRLTDMYGTCKCVKLYRDGDQVGDSHRSITANGPTWFIDCFGLEASFKENPARTVEENLQIVGDVLTHLARVHDAMLIDDTPDLIADVLRAARAA